MDDVNKFAWAHAVLLIVAAVLPAITRSLRDDVKFMPTWPSSVRLSIVGILTAAGTIVDQVSNGPDWRSALVAALIAGLPSIVIEMVHLFGTDKSGPGGTGSIDLAKQSRDPSTGAKMVALVLALVLALCALPACAGAQKTLQDVTNVASIVAADVHEVEQWVNIISGVADVFFRAANQPDAQKVFDQAKQSVLLAIAGVTAAAQVAHDVNDAAYGAAVEDLRKAYDAFLAAAKKAGFVTAANSMMAAKNGKVQPVAVPELRLLKR